MHSGGKILSYWFLSQERAQLECQLPYFQIDVCNSPELKELSTLAALTSGLFKTWKYSSYPMVDRLLRLVLTLLVSTATTERCFSAMKLAKTRLRCTMGDGFLRDCLVIYIENELAASISTDDIITTYDLAASRRTKFKLIDICNFILVKTCETCYYYIIICD